MKSFDDFFPGKIYRFTGGDYIKTPFMLINKEPATPLNGYCFTVLRIRSKNTELWRMSTQMIPFIEEVK